MNKDEKRAFWKFFLTYFISVALLILVAGYFYFIQMKQQFLKFEHFSMIKYAKKLKLGESVEGLSGYTYKYVNRNFENFSIDNFVHKDNKFEKWIPANRWNKYIFISKDDTEFNEKLKLLFYRLAGIQLLLLAVFGSLSFFLARNALAPLRQNIQKLDRFAKDLIHDLNTPVTSISLNIKVLNKEPSLKDHRALQRIQKSANDISDLHKNLSFLLKEKNYELQNVDLKQLIETLVQEYASLYPNLRFITQDVNGKVEANTLALKQILDNLLSNACKYSKNNGTIKFSYSEKRLEILDDGIGIKNPERVFERNYTEHAHGSGIGLDIVKRLCDMMQIKIEVKSLEKGTLVVLEFN